MGTSGIDCPFCGVAAREDVLADRLAFARRDGYPVSKGHTLIIPRRHVRSFFDCVDDERQAMLSLLDRAKALLDQQYHPDGYNIGINDGAAAGQTVMHLHIHLISRYVGDCADARGGVRWIFPDKAAYWRKE
jgi:diadenosine tetraphosphate (Ap4A) HIT family hydrolase